MWLALSMTSSLISGAGFSGLILPWRSFSFRYSLSCSAWIRARRKCSPSSRAASWRTSAAHSRFRVGAAGPGRAHQHRDVGRPGRLEHQLHVPLHRLLREHALAAAQGVGAVVRGAAVGTDEVGLPLHGPSQGTLKVAGADDAGGGEGSYHIHHDAPPAKSCLMGG